MKTYRRVLLASLCLAASSVAWPIIISDQADDSRHLKLASDYPSPVVVRWNDAGSASGMGVWINEKWILTAAHVAAGVKPGDSIGDDGDLVVEEVSVHPDWHSQMIDLGLIKVASSPADIEVVPVCESGDQNGATVVFVGAGDIGTGDSGPIGADGKLRMARNKAVLANEAHLVFEFDAPNSPGAVALEGISGPGDSGGPAYLESEDGFCIVAVSSGQDSEPTGGKEGRFGVIEFYTRVDVRKPWIDSVSGEIPAK